MRKIDINYSQFLFRLFLVLLAFEVFILLADILLNMNGLVSSRALRRSFNITREDSIGNWFSSLQFFLLAASCCILAVVQKIKRVNWLACFGLFMLFAIDDATQLHERVGSAFKVDYSFVERGMIEKAISLYPSYPWQVVVGPIYFLLGVGLLMFLWKELRDQRKLLVLVFATFSLAVGLDFIEGSQHQIYHVLAQWLSSSAAVVGHYFKAAEEFLEMLASSVLLLALMRHFFESLDGIELNWSNRRL